MKRQLNNKIFENYVTKLSTNSELTDTEIRGIIRALTCASDGQQQSILDASLNCYCKTSRGILRGFSTHYCIQFGRGVFKPIFVTG